MSITRKLVEFCHQLKPEDLPGEVLDKVKYCTLDFLGVALRGGTMPSSETIRDFIADLRCPGSSVIMGTEMTSSPQYAALANAAAGHSPELDDVNNESSLHPGVVVLPTAIAASELAGADGLKFATAVVLGYEVMVKLGKALNPAESYRRGFHPTSTCGAFGATIVAAKLLNLSEEQTLNAMGIAGSQTSGCMEYLSEGTWAKRFQPGWAAHSGLLAALLARKGFTGPSTIIEGKAGFLHAHSGQYDEGKVARDLGAPFEILRTSTKPHACCRYKQGPIDGVLQIMRENQLKAQDVEKVTIGLLQAGFPIVGEPVERKRNPHTITDAQFSMPFGAAVAMLCGKATVEEYTEEKIESPEVKALMQKVFCVSDPELEKVFPQKWPATAEIQTKDGKGFSTRIDYPKGDPENPLSWEELTNKFHDLASIIYPQERREKIVSRVEALPQERNIRDFCQLLTGNGVEV